MENEQVERELLWRQYHCYLELYKYYLELSLKGNVFFYLITGSILTFYFTHHDEALVKYSLILPIIMSLALGLAFILGAILTKGLGKDFVDLSSQLGFNSCPSVKILIVLLYSFGSIFIIVAMAMILLFLIPFSAGLGGEIQATPLQ
ncbi:MAG TPA: hypothetical protein VF527_11765 [Pyrinomonadaceae bacterium]|jgi:hypothetical protein